MGCVLVPRTQLDQTHCTFLLFILLLVNISLGQKRKSFLVFSANVWSWLWNLNELFADREKSKANFYRNYQEGKNVAFRMEKKWPKRSPNAWEMYKIYWPIFDLSVLYLRMVLTVRSKQTNHDYTKMKTKNKQTRGLERTHTLLLETTTIFC